MICLTSIFIFRVFKVFPGNPSLFISLLFFFCFWNFLEFLLVPPPPPPSPQKKRISSLCEHLRASPSSFLFPPPSCFALMLTSLLVTILPPPPVMKVGYLFFLNMIFLCNVELSSFVCNFWYFVGSSSSIWIPLLSILIKRVPIISVGETNVKIKKKRIRHEDLVAFIFGRILWKV